SLLERSCEVPVRLWRPTNHLTDTPGVAGRLRFCNERPCRRTAKQCDELAPAAHSITSSARNTIDSGTVRAGAMAVLACSAVIVSIGEFPSPGSEPERVFTTTHPSIP